MAVAARIAGVPAVCLSRRLQLATSFFPQPPSSSSSARRDGGCPLAAGAVGIAVRPRRRGRCQRGDLRARGRSVRRRARRQQRRAHLGSGRHVRVPRGVPPPVALQAGVEWRRRQEQERDDREGRRHVRRLGARERAAYSCGEGAAAFYRRHRRWAPRAVGGAVPRLVAVVGS